MHLKWYRCETERLQSLLRAAGAPAKACNLVPAVVQTCQVCREWRRPGNANKLTFSLAESFNEEVQFDLLFYKSLLQPTLGGEKGIPICHLMGCCIRWSACTTSPTRNTANFLNCISNSWIMVFERMETLTLDGESGMRAKEVDDWAMYNRVTFQARGTTSESLVRRAARRVD